MRAIGYAAILLGIVIAITPALAGQTYIPRGDAFMLGGEQTQPFRVTGRNTGAVAVEVIAETSGQRTSLGQVAPGKSFGQRFEPGQIAVFRNMSATRQAIIQIDLSTVTVSLSMRYQLPQKN
jgi:hypothetical protein